MFENEARERAKRKIYNFIVSDLGVSQIITGQTCETVEGIPHFYQYSLEKMWQEGAEYGYKYKENEWHYMEDELPPKKVPLNIITFDKNKKRRVWVGEYDGGNGQWWTGYFNHFIDVPYAWREIILPEQEG